MRPVEFSLVALRIVGVLFCYFRSSDATCIIRVLSYLWSCLVMPLIYVTKSLTCVHACDLQPRHSVSSELKSCSKKRPKLMSPSRLEALLDSTFPSYFVFCESTTIYIIRRFRAFWWRMTMGHMSWGSIYRFRTSFSAWPWSSWGIVSECILGEVCLPERWQVHDVLYINLLFDIYINCFYSTST